MPTHAHGPTIAVNLNNSSKSSLQPLSSTSASTLRAHHFSLWQHLSSSCSIKSRCIYHEVEPAEISQEVNSRHLISGCLNLQEKEAVLLKMMQASQLWKKKLLAQRRIKFLLKRAQQKFPSLIGSCSSRNKIGTSHRDLNHRYGKCMGSYGLCFEMTDSCVG